MAILHVLSFLNELIVYIRWDLFLIRRLPDKTVVKVKSNTILGWVPG